MEQYATELDRKFHAHMIVAEKKDDLWDLCQKFIDKHGITCAEAIHQTDRVAENSPELLEEIAKLVGYATPEESKSE